MWAHSLPLQCFVCGAAGTAFCTAARCVPVRCCIIMVTQDRLYCKLGSLLGWHTAYRQHLLSRAQAGSGRIRFSQNSSRLHLSAILLPFAQKELAVRCNGECKRTGHVVHDVDGRHAHGGTITRRMHTAVHRCVLAIARRPPHTPTHVQGLLNGHFCLL